MKASSITADQIRETFFSALEGMVRTGEIRGARRRKLRRAFTRSIGRYLKGETDPAKRARLEDIIRGLEEAETLAAPTDNPSVISSAIAAHCIRSRKM
jgi:hypothetical protein